MKEIAFKTNINCSGCVARITPLLNEIKAVKSWNVNIQDPAKILTVQAEENIESAITDAVKKAGFTIEKV